MLNLKAGYHTGSDLSRDNGFPDGFLIDGGFEFGITRNLVIGMNFERWIKDNVITHPMATNLAVVKNCYSYGYRFYVQFRTTIFRRFFLSADAGLGEYKVYHSFISDDGYLNDGNIYYLNTGVSFGVGYILNKFIMLESQVSWYGLNPRPEKIKTSLINFKIGPSVYFQLNKF